MANVHQQAADAGATLPGDTHGGWFEEPVILLGEEPSTFNLSNLEEVMALDEIEQLVTQVSE